MQPAITQTLRRFLRYVRYAAEAIMVFIGFILFRALPLDTASSLGGWLGREIGPLLPVTNVARRNIDRALADLPAQEKAQLITDMWDNLGRSIGEFPHLPRLTASSFAERVMVEGQEHMRTLLEQKKPTLFFGAHLSNWEIGAKTIYESGVPVTVIYRHANNPFVEWLLHWARRTSHSRGMFPKGRVGAKEALAALKRNECLGLLVDQKMNDGIVCNFFGQPAMTAPALASLALKFNCPIIPLQSIRLKGAYFKVIVHPPLVIGPGATQQTIMQQVNDMLESWIRAHPAQWLWVHKRWDSAKLNRKLTDK